MRKTSVYLPDHLKRALSARAAATRRSEAEVLRSAIELEVLARGPAAVKAAITYDSPVPGRLVGVGVGPGDPDLLTMRALHALRRADRVIGPSTSPDAIGRAETILREAAPDVQVERVAFAMHPDPELRAQAMGEIADTVAGYLNDGEEVAFITLGDPLTYSTFSALADAVEARRPGTQVEVVPGIMAFQSLASRTRTTLVDERQRLSVRTALDGDDDPDLARDLADPQCTVVLYKGGRHLPALTEAARQAGRLDDAVVGELLGMTGQRVGPLRQLGTAPASYLATVILPAPEGTVPPTPPVLSAHPDEGGPDQGAPDQGAPDGDAADGAGDAPGAGGKGRRTRRVGAS
ncbi:MAG TPA: precorrin-2 C(20)-methyltransferase [Acidimicrobiales bacterium]